MTTQFPPLPGTATPPLQQNFDMTGAGEVARVLQARDVRQRRKKRDPRPEDMSVLTQAAVSASQFAKEMRVLIKSVTPAPFMKAKLNRRVARERFATMSPEERVMLARKWGVRLFVKVAEELGFKDGIIPTGEDDAS